MIHDAQARNRRAAKSMTPRRPPSPLELELGAGAPARTRGLRRPWPRRVYRSTAESSQDLSPEQRADHAPRRCALGSEVAAPGVLLRCDARAHRKLHAILAACGLILGAW